LLVLFKEGEKSCFKKSESKLSSNLVFDRRGREINKKGGLRRSGLASIRCLKQINKRAAQEPLDSSARIGSREASEGKNEFSYEKRGKELNSKVRHLGARRGKGGGRTLGEITMPTLEC